MTDIFKTHLVVIFLIFFLSCSSLSDDQAELLIFLENFQWNHEYSETDSVLLQRLMPISENDAYFLFSQYKKREIDSTSFKFSLALIFSQDLNKAFSKEYSRLAFASASYIEKTHGANADPEYLFFTKHYKSDSLALDSVIFRMNQYFSNGEYKKYKFFSGISTEESFIRASFPENKLLLKKYLASDSIVPATKGRVIQSLAFFEEYKRNQDVYLFLRDMLQLFPESHLYQGALIKSRHCNFNDYLSIYRTTESKFISNNIIDIVSDSIKSEFLDSIEINSGLIKRNVSF